MEEPGGLQSMGSLESDTPERLHFHALEKEMATHSSVLAWRIPGTWEPDGLLFMGSHRVGHDWGDLAAAAHCWFMDLPCLCEAVEVEASYLRLFSFDWEKEEKE